MRIAAISDIHGDLRSLQAVWRDIEERGLAENPVLNAGDTVAYGTQNVECLQFVRDPSKRIVNVGGNYDYSVAKFPKKMESYQKKWGKLRPEKFDAIQRASGEIDEDAREWLKDLPSHVALEMNDVSISLSHYAPIDGKIGLHVSTPTSTFEEIVAQIAPAIKIVITGHTHSAFVRSVEDVLFVNPGSVGRSFGALTYAEITMISGAASTGRILQCRATL